MFFLQITSIDNFKKFAYVIKKHRDMKLSLVHEKLAKIHGYPDFQSVAKFAAEGEKAEPSNSSCLVSSDDQIKLWVKRLEEVFGTEVLTVFDHRSDVKWLMSICALNQGSTDHDELEISNESNSVFLKKSPDVSTPPPVITYKKRRKF